MVVVETSDDYGGMMLPTLALAAGREVAAVPGQITVPESEGAHALLADGAHLVRGAKDVLDLLYGVGCTPPSAARTLSMTPLRAEKKVTDARPESRILTIQSNKKQS